MKLLSTLLLVIFSLLSSLAAAENCGLSGMIARPQMRQTIERRSGSASRKPATRAQAPETARQAIATVVRPIRSAISPPATQDTPPTATIENPMAYPARADQPACSYERSTNSGAHAHMAYSSHMCPR